jgi:hypothetical protein
MPACLPDRPSATPRRRPSLPRPEGYAASEDAGRARVQVSAEEAAARLTAAPAHDNSDWPQCAGKCYEGMCALRSDHPACCFVPKSQSYHLTTGHPYS